MRHASGSYYSQEIDTLNKIERFGLEAITGRRQFFYGELKKMIVAENIVTSYHSRAQSKNWGEWAVENKDMARILADAEILLQDN